MKGLTMQDKPNMECWEAFERWYTQMYPDPIPEYAINKARIIKDNRWVVWHAAWNQSRAIPDQTNALRPAHAKMK